MGKRFEGKTAFVTGGSRGIGREIVEQFAQEGANVAIIDVNEETLEDLCLIVIYTTLFLVGSGLIGVLWYLLVEEVTKRKK